MRRLLVALLLAMFVLGAAPKKKTAPPPPAPAAPEVVPHSMALFLKALCKDGTRQITFRANAVGTRFFIEEPTGVTVYRFDKGQYMKDEFMRGAKLAAALKKYATR